MASLPIPANAQLERLATGAAWSEGPLWLPELDGVIWSDIPGNRILAWRRDGGELEVWRSDVEFTNGRVRWGGGVVQCSHGRRALELDRDGVVTTLVDRTGSHRLNSPNDVTTHPDGSLWFTDPPYGIVQPHEGHPGEQEYGGCHVFRLHDGVLASVITDIRRPNGLGFSPDGRTLYVTDTSAALGDGPEHRINAYEIDVTDGVASVRSARVLTEVAPGVPDGIAVDVEGRVWSSSASGVQVFGADGAPLGTIDVPEVVGNLTFGGPDNDELYVAATTSLYRIRTSTAGVL